MKKYIREYLLAFIKLDAWERNKITETLEKRYQLMRRQIIIQTIIITAVCVGVLSSIIVAYIK